MQRREQRKRLDLYLEHLKKKNNRGVKRGVLSYFPAKCGERDVFSYFPFEELFFFFFGRITLYKRTNKGTRKRLFELCLGKYFICHTNNRPDCIPSYFYCLQTLISFIDVAIATLLPSVVVKLLSQSSLRA